MCYNIKLLISRKVKAYEFKIYKLKNTRKMKKYLLFILVAIFTCNLVVCSQNQQRGDKNRKEGARPEMKYEKPTAEQRAEKMAKELDLTDKQKTQLQTLFEKQDAEREKERSEMKMQQEDRQAKAKANREAQDAEMKKILGDEKFQQLETKRAERRDMMKQHQMDGKKPQRPEERKESK